MQVIDDLGRFDDILEKAPQHTETLKAVRSLILALHPEATEKASAREGSVWWGVGRRKMIDGYAWCMPHTAHVNLGFFQGVHLPDPQHRLEGTGKSLRHVRLSVPQDLDDRAISDLVAAARDERRAALNR